MKEKLANMKASFTSLAAHGASIGDPREMMEEYVVHCEQAIKTSKKNDFPKRLETKLEENQHARDNQALAKRVPYRKGQQQGLRLVVQHLQQ